jgi:hypothetical protein
MSIATDFKKVLHEEMIRNFERDGYLTPLLFFLRDNQPIIITIPNELLLSPDGKIQLATKIKTICMTPNVRCAGIIIEACGTKVNADSEIAKLILDGNIKISELNEHVDIIIMIYSTRENDDFIAYQVDCENKTVGERFIDDNAIGFTGTFSKFFKWTQN